MIGFHLDGHGQGAFSFSFRPVAHIHLPSSDDDAVLDENIHQGLSCGPQPRNEDVGFPVPQGEIAYTCSARDGRKRAPATERTDKTPTDL